MQNSTQEILRSILVAMGAALLIFGAFLIGFYIYIQSFSGTVITSTGNLIFQGNVAQISIQQELSPDDNPLRPQIKLKYQEQAGRTILGSKTLTEYTISIQENASQQNIYQNTGKFSYSQSSSDREEAGIKSTTTSKNATDFVVETAGTYTITFSAKKPGDLDTDLMVDSTELSLRGQVKSLPFGVLLAGLGFLGGGVLSLIIYKTISKKIDLPQ